MAETGSTVAKLDYALIRLHDETSNNVIPMPTINKGHPSGFTAEVESGMQVIKIGRTTGKRAGVVSGTKETQKGISGITTTEFVVIGQQGGMFGLKGDSGAGVWDKKGHLIGLLWGSNPVHNINYITSIRSILSHIHSYTGLSLSVKVGDQKDKWMGQEEEYMEVEIPDELRSQYILPGMTDEDGEESDGVAWLW